MYGAITKSYTVWCSDADVCCHTENLELSVDNKRAFVREIRRAGWRQIQGVWYCPTCVRQQKGGTPS